MNICSFGKQPQSFAPSTAQLLEMVQKLTGRLEKMEEKGTLTDEVGKVGEAMTAAMEELGDKLGDKMNDVAATLGDTLTEGLEKFAETLHANANEKYFDNNRAYAEYRFFAIDGPDSFYRLHVDGDSLTDNNNRPFSTHDSDHDSSPINCAVLWRGAWWYRMCGSSNLNGVYLTSRRETYKSIYWFPWKNAWIVMKHVEMKMRPAM
nr:hypothetical protein BaRGS_001961 [Batillaria attramentaria]